jgi:uncharacterized membrane protein
LSYLIKNAHFLVIHVPIAMLLFSFLFDLFAKILKKKDWHTAGMLCLVIGALGAIAAVLTGPEGEENPLFPKHELFGKLTMILSILLVVVRLGLLLWKKLDISKSLVYLLAMLVCVGLVSYTGHLGGKMVHPDKSGFQRGPGQGPGNFPGQGQGNRPGQGQGNPQQGNTDQPAVGG